jgi:hypothetical protein
MTVAKNTVQKLRRALRQAVLEYHDKLVRRMKGPPLWSEWSQAVVRNGL